MLTALGWFTTDQRQNDQSSMYVGNGQQRKAKRIFTHFESAALPRHTPMTDLTLKEPRGVRLMNIRFQYLATFFLDPTRQLCNLMYNFNLSGRSRMSTTSPSGISCGRHQAGTDSRISQRPFLRGTPLYIYVTKQLFERQLRRKVFLRSVVRLDQPSTIEPINPFCGIRGRASKIPTIPPCSFSSFSFFFIFRDSGRDLPIIRGQLKFGCHLLIEFSNR